ncbi:hypothetical protein WJX74_007506 [Apatococcus lobatus]|uniref:Uncharacterized protein n=1 Tax=Apatococcus lobatus TaxID=904363 RepID=A0AAW1RFN2_9CHLO
MFVQQLNQTTGEPELVHIDQEDVVAPGQALTQLVSSSLYLDELNDKLRNDSYLGALKSMVRPGDHVLDIGTGSGLLSCLAVNALQAQGQDVGEKTVTAIEAFPPMAALAKAVLRANGMTDEVQVISKHSSDVTVFDGDDADMQQKADVIVTEIFDSELLGEGVLPSLQHALSALAKDGAHVIPAGADIYAQLVECSFLRNSAVVQGKDDLQPLRELHVDSLYPEHLALLTNPVKLFSFDFHKPRFPGTSTVEAEVIAEGRADAIILWWNLYLDSQHRFNLSTSPAWVATFAAASSPPPSGPSTTNAASLSEAMRPSYPPDNHSVEGLLDTSAPAAVQPSGISSSTMDAQEPPGIHDMHAARKPVSCSACITTSQGESAGLGAGDRTAKQEWRDHWKTCWVPVAGACASSAVSPGQVATFHAAHDETSITLGAEVHPAQHSHLSPGEPLDHAEAAAQDAAPAGRGDACQLVPAQMKPAQHAKSEAGRSQLCQQNLASAQPDAMPSLGLASASQHTTARQLPHQAVDVADQASSCSQLTQLTPSELQSATAKSLQCIQVPQELLHGAAPMRTWVLQQEEYWAGLWKGVTSAADTLLPGATCLVLGDSPHLALMAAHHCHISRVLCVLSAPLDAAKARRAASRAGVAGKTHFILDLEELRATTGPGSVQLVVSEPYMRQREGCLPWDHLQILADSLHGAGSPLPELLHPDASILPSAARICGIGVDAKDLLRTRAPLGHIQGLDMSLCNALLCPGTKTEGAGTTSIGCQSWQIGEVQELTEPVELITLSPASRDSDVRSEGRLRVSESGSLNAVVCWMEYMHDCTQTSWQPSCRPCAPHGWAEAMVILPECLAFCMVDSGASPTSVRFTAAWHQGQLDLQVLPV